MEEWKEIKSIRTNCGTLIKWLFSNKGRVKLEAYCNNCKLDEEILSLGHCLYIYNNLDIKVYNVSGCFYRKLYELFVGIISKGYHIHHKDYNHYNNDVNNLECISAYQHHLKHGKDLNKIQFKESRNKEIELNNKYANYTKEDACNDLKNIYNRFDIKYKEYTKLNKDEYKENKKQEQIKRHQQYIEDKLATGNYKYEDGKLVYIRPKWTEERRRKTQQTRENSEAWKNRTEKISDTLKEYFKQPENRKKQLEQLACIREIRLNKLK